MGGIDVLRGRRHRRIELQDRFRRLFLVPERHRQDAAVRKGAHIGFHRLARIGKLLDNGEAARVRQADGIGEAQIDDVETLVRMGEKMPALVVDDADF